MKSFADCGDSYEGETPDCQIEDVPVQIGQHQQDYHQVIEWRVLEGGEVDVLAGLNYPEGARQQSPHSQVQQDQQQSYCEDPVPGEGRAGRGVAQLAKLAQEYTGSSA